MLKGYLQALLDRYYREYRIATKNNDAVRMPIYKHICEDLSDMRSQVLENTASNNESKHIAMVFVGKSADFAEYLKKEGVKLQ